MPKPNTIFFLRHAETEQNKTVPATEWTLSKTGILQASQIAQSGVFDGVDLIVTSVEEKAYQTAEPIARRLSKNIKRFSEFNEMRRGEKYLSKEEFENLKREKLEDIDCKKDGGESGREALERFESGIRKLCDANPGKNILIVSHGTVLALYFAKMTNDFSDIYERWQNTGYCAWGKIIGNCVLKDLTREKY